MRDKERLHDYRFMPEPNLPPLTLYTNATLPCGLHVQDQIVNVDSLQQNLPPLPEARRTMLQQQYGLSLAQACILVVRQNDYL